MTEKRNESKPQRLLRHLVSLRFWALIIILVWAVVVIAIPSYISIKNKDSAKEFAVVKGFSLVNDTLQSEYEKIISKVKKINVVDKIPMDKIKPIDSSKITNKIAEQTKGLTNTVDQVKKTSDFLGAFGVKSEKVDQVTSSKYADPSKLIEDEINKINKEIEDTKKEIESDLQKAYTDTIDKEGRKILEGQISDKTGLKGSALTSFLSGNYGIMTGSKRASTSAIYKSLLASDTAIIKTVVQNVDKYFGWGFWAVLGLYILVLGILPIITFWWIINLLTGRVATCPMCDKKFVEGGLPFFNKLLR